MVIDGGHIRQGILAGVVVFLAMGFTGRVVLAQRDSAATEAEWTEDEAGPFRGDPHRDPDLRRLSSMEGQLEGAAHIGRFLDAWSALLSGSEIPGSAAPLQIAHFGGSHVQAGRIGWAFRTRLAEDRPGIVAGRGIQPPHRLVGSNGPPERGWRSDQQWAGSSCANRRHQGEWGLTGVEATCDGATQVACWSGGSAGEMCCSVVRIFARPDSAPGWQPEPPLAWTAGHANTLETGIAQWTSSRPASVPDTVWLAADNEDVGVLQGVEWWPDSVDFVFHDLGANGASSTSWMRSPHFPVQLQAVSPDLAILAWGINDAHMPTERFSKARFLDHYRTLIQAFRAACPDIELMLVTNNDTYYRGRHNPNAEQVRSAMRELVKTEEVACWDLYGHMGGRGSVEWLQQAGFAASDRLHMRKDGYVLWGELLYELLTRAALAENKSAP